tara:strand:+ start:1245 stop:1565 length:321 start_codon:yes stop_codon:yes gene_type:complete
MNIQETIITKLTNSLALSHIEVINESFMHNVPPDSETHFKLVVVAKDFDQKNRLQRQKLVYQILSTELSGAVHALTMHTLTPHEWEKDKSISTTSPECLGGSATDN